MPRTSVIRRVSRPWEALYNLVLDVERYPEFVPFCRSVTVVKRTEIEQKSELMAVMEVGFSALRERYTSRISGINSQKTIKIESNDGPFVYLTGLWVFSPIDERNTNVSFFVEYEFRSRLMSALSERSFNSIFGEFIYAFEDRAKDTMRMRIY